MLLAVVMLVGVFVGAVPTRVEAATSQSTLDWMEDKYIEILGKYEQMPQTNDWWKILEIGKAGGTVKQADIDWLRGQIDGKEKIRPNPMMKHILALRASGINPRNYYDKVLDKNRDLINELLTKNSISSLEGFWVVTFVLPAINSDNYDLTSEEQAVVDELVDKLIDQRKPGEYNGKLWNLFGVTDSTGAALAALAPYYEDNSRVKLAVDEALVEFANLVNEDGSLGATQPGYANNSNSTAFSLLGVGSYTKNGVNMVDSDEYTTSSGKTMIDGMKVFDIPGDGFSWQLGMSSNDMATEQCFRAMIHYKSMTQGQEGQRGIYNLRNVDIKDDIPVYDGELFPDFSKYNIVQNGKITLGAKDEDGQTVTGITWTLEDETMGSIDDGVFTANTKTGIFNIVGTIGEKTIEVPVSVFSPKEVKKKALVRAREGQFVIHMDENVTVDDLDLSHVGITRAYDEVKVIHILVKGLEQKLGTRDIYPDNFDHEDNGGIVTKILNMDDSNGFVYRFINDAERPAGGVSDTEVKNKDMIEFDVSTGR